MLNPWSWFFQAMADEGTSPATVLSSVLLLGLVLTDQGPRRYERVSPVKATWPSTGLLKVQGLWQPRGPSLRSRMTTRNCEQTVLGRRLLKLVAALGVTVGELIGET